VGISEHARQDFSKDGGRLFLGTAPAPKPQPKDAPEPIKVDIWHWRDADLQPMQRVRAEAEKRRSYPAVVHLKDRRFVQLATPEMPALSISDDAERAVGTSDVRYRHLVSWDGSYDDVYSVNLRDGSRQQVLEKTPFGATLSPGPASTSRATSATAISCCSPTSCMRSVTPARAR
jgi:hypothetical protein